MVLGRQTMDLLIKVLFILFALTGPMADAKGLFYNGRGQMSVVESNPEASEGASLCEDPNAPPDIIRACINRTLRILSGVQFGHTRAFFGFAQGARDGLRLDSTLAQSDAPVGKVQFFHFSALYLKEHPGRDPDEGPSSVFRLYLSVADGEALLSLQK